MKTFPKVAASLVGIYAILTAVSLVPGYTDHAPGFVSAPPRHVQISFDDTNDEAKVDGELRKACKRTPPLGIRAVADRSDKVLLDIGEQDGKPLNTYTIRCSDLKIIKRDQLGG